MEVREWALVAFTILAQMAVGSFLVLGVVHLFASRKAGEAQADQLSDRALLAIGPLLVLGLVASLAHLGSPLNAPNAINNLATSWLSREILSGVSFTVVGGAFALMQARKIGSFALRNMVAWAAALIGLFLVLAMSNVYMLPTRPSWNVITTPLSFFNTTLLLGVLAMGAAFVVNYAYVRRKNPDCATQQCELLRGALRGLALASIVLLGVEFVILPIGLALQTSAGAGVAVSMLTTQFSGLLALRLALVFLGAGIMALFVYQASQKAGQERMMGTLVVGAFALVSVAEVIGRFLFYAAMVRIGL